MITREEFESKPEWRATIQRRNRLAFIWEGQGKLAGRFYECPENWSLWYRVGPELEIRVDTAKLHNQLEAGQIELLNGALP
jgi:hypothetical protein